MPACLAERMTVTAFAEPAGLTKNVVRQAYRRRWNRRRQPQTAQTPKAARQRPRLGGGERERCARSIHGSAARNDPRRAIRPPATGLRLAGQRPQRRPQPARRRRRRGRRSSVLLAHHSATRRASPIRRRLGSACRNCGPGFRWAPVLSAGRPAKGGMQLFNAPVRQWAPLGVHFARRLALCCRPLCTAPRWSVWMMHRSCCPDPRVRVDGALL